MSVRRNLIANFVGNAFAGAVALLFIPVYLHAIGAEGYGLVGFFITLASLTTVFDGGFGAAAARQLARSSELPPDQSSTVRNLIRTLEWLFGAMACLLGALTSAAAPLIVDDWLNLGDLPRAQALVAVRLMGLALALQWPIAYYSGCLVGLQRQVGLNVVNAITLTMRYGGAAIVVTTVDRTVSAFFAWQAFSALVQLLVLRLYLWQQMPGASEASFDFSELRGIGGFALGVGGINVLGLILTQIDKVILSKLLPLKLFGYYTMAAALASVISRIVMPVFNAIYPRLATLAATRSEAELASFYRSACGLMALAIVPLSSLLILFGREIVQCWTGDAELAQNLRWVVAILCAGTLFNGLMTIPYALQLAVGWTSLALSMNLIAVVVVISTIGMLTSRFGLEGAAFVWLVVNAGYVMIGAPIMFGRVLPGERRTWFLRAVLLPSLVALATLWLLRMAIGPLVDYSRVQLFAFIAAAGIVTQLVTMKAVHSSAFRVFGRSASTAS